jgi:hypothetical protein
MVIKHERKMNYLNLIYPVNPRSHCRLLEKTHKKQNIENHEFCPKITRLGTLVRATKARIFYGFSTMAHGPEWCQKCHKKMKD